MIVGGLDLWRSADGGASLTQISLWYVDGSVHADHHAIVGDPSLGKPGAPNRVFFGNDGGVFKTDDYATVGADANKTQGWVRLENGYGVTQFYGAAGHAATGDIIGGAQDNGTVRYTTAGGPNAWTSMFGGDGGWCAADPGDPNYFYGEYVYAQIHRSQDAGKTADYICGQFYDPHRGWSWKPVPYQIPDARAQRALFIAPFVIDPSNPSTILVGAMSLWRTLDAKTANDDVAQTGPSWSEIKPSLNIPISALAIDPTNSNAIWVGDQTGQVFATSNGTGALPQWRQIAGGAGSPLSLNRYCSSVLISGGEIYVTFAAYRGGVPGSNVWRTTDGGQTFTDLGQALPDAPVHKIAKHPTKPGYLYVGTEIGLFASDDDGATWAPTNEGPTNSPVYDLIWMNNALVCCTHGRGMWKIDI